MNDRPTTLERAYQLAKSGECRTVSEIKQRLTSEGYHNVAGQLYGPALAASLRKHMNEALAASG